MTHGSLFTGIGGFDLAAEKVGFKNIFQVERDTFCTKVLEKNFPHVQRFADIKKFDGRRYRGTVDIVSGGFPCQPYSVAGQRRGKQDDRALWSEMFRVIKEIRPPFVVCENVLGLISMELDEVLFDLESENYKTETFVLPAISIGAPHIRNRVWIIAYANGKRKSQPQRSQQKKRERISDRNQHSADSDQFNVDDARFYSGKVSQFEATEILNDTSNTGSKRFEERMQHFHLGETANPNERTWNDDWYEVATELCRVDDGLPARMDGLELTKAQHRSERLKALGNAIVHQIATIIFEAIKTFEVIK